MSGGVCDGVACVSADADADAGTDTGALRLRQRLADLTASGQGDLRAVVGEFRRSEVLVPVVDGSLLSAELGGVRWLFAFTDGAALRRFGEARGETFDECVPVYGGWLLDRVVPEAGGPTGIAVDAGSAAGMVLPPVAGIVPDAVAVDAEGTGAKETGAEGTGAGRGHAEGAGAEGPGVKRADA